MKHPNTTFPDIFLTDRDSLVRVFLYASEVFGSGRRLYDGLLTGRIVMQCAIAALRGVVMGPQVFAYAERPSKACLPSKTMFLGRI